MPSLPHVPKIVYENISRGLKAKHMLKREKPCQIAFGIGVKKVRPDITAYYEIETNPFLSQLYKMVILKNLELAANIIH